MKRALAIAILLILVVAVSYGATRLAVRTTRVRPATCQALSALEDYLAVTPGQKQALAAVDAQFGAARPQLRDHVWQTRDELVATLEDPNSTRAQAVEKARQFCAAQKAMQLNTVEYMVELRQHLTPAQRQKLAGLVGRGMCTLTGGPCGRGMGRGMGNGMGGGMGGPGGRGNGFCGGRGMSGGGP
jgi:Spy/CpxP family protein refolding chaperone